MDKAKEKVIEIMQVFLQQEQGNTITQFNTQGLLTMILTELDVIRDGEKE